jgi:hypothetical protein
MLRPKSPGLRQIPIRPIEAPARPDPGQQWPPDGATKAPGTWKIMWFISHNAAEIVDFRFNSWGLPGTVASEPVAEGGPSVLLLGVQRQQLNDCPAAFV